MMDNKTKKSYKTIIEQYKILIDWFESEEDLETARYFKEKLIEIEEEYDYLKTNKEAFKQYLKRHKSSN